MSHQNPPDAARVSRIFFYILMFAILGWFTYMQLFRFHDLHRYFYLGEV